MVLSKLARSAALGSLSLGLLAGRSSAECPQGLDPYSVERNPFGWPITPAEFTYERTECWAANYKQCGGQRQSPMELDLLATGQGCEVSSAGEPGALTSRASYTILAGRPEVAVSKYMRGVSVPGKLGTLRLKDSAGNDVEYEAVDAILMAGGLHSINGHVPDAELIIVHQRKGHADAFDSRVIVSVIFEKSETGSAFFEQLGLSNGNIPETVSWRTPQSVDLGAVTAEALAGPSLSYSGSMPAPPCSENVQYFVLQNSQQVSADQLASLEGVLHRFAGGIHKRVPVKRVDANGVCRSIVQNAVEAAASPAPAHVAGCSRWPASIVSGEADHSQDPRAASEFLSYRPTKSVTVKASPQSLDAYGDFGSAFVNGRNFVAKKISVKAVSSSIVDGHRYAAELIVEHVMFGDDIAAAPHVDTPVSHGPAVETASTTHAPHHRRLEAETSGAGDASVVRRVLVSIPLKLGRESAVLRSLGLGMKAHQAAIRDGNGYDLHTPVDLQTGLQSSTSKGWYWYVGSDGRQAGCPASSERWMVFEEPLEVSVEQLNSLALQVSGLDSTQPAKHIAGALVHRSFVPASGAEEHWTAASTLCHKGEAQSPINIPRSAIEKGGNETFLAKCSWKPLKGLRVENDGASLAVRSNQLGYTTVMGDNGFPKFYQVTDVLLKMPSEHMIDGKQFAAELQVVQKNQKTVLEFDDDDAIVSSFFFSIGEESKLLKQFLPAKLPGAGEFEPISQPVDLQWALGPALNGPFYKYDGSYTSSQCQEAVQWTIFDTPMTLSEAQFQAFRAVFPEGNTRPLQPLNGRRLLKNSLGEGQIADVQLFLNRSMGRNKADTPIGLILFPIVGTLTLCLVSMTAIFQREDRELKSTSAGGLEGQASTIGKGYGQL